MKLNYGTDAEVEKVRDGLRAMVAHGIIRVVTPHDDPLEAKYVMPDPEGVGRALEELGVK